MEGDAIPQGIASPRICRHFGVGEAVMPAFGAADTVIL
jgi:hypothetical protein